MGPSSPPPPGITRAPPEWSPFFLQIAQFGVLSESSELSPNFFHFQLMEAPETSDIVVCENFRCSIWGIHHRLGCSSPFFHILPQL